MLVGNRGRLHTLLSWLVVSILGTVEGLYGRTEYLGDWISYLNVSQSVSRLDWKGIFDPMWTPGYPVLIALARSLFPHNAEGEWYAIALLNWIIFLGAFAALKLLVRRAVAFYDPSMLEQLKRPAMVWSICLIFLSFGLCFDKVSRVSPDLLVSTLFLLSAAQLFRILIQPSGTNAAMLGLLLGLGYLVKGVFLTYAAIFLLTLFLVSLTRKIPWRIAAVSAACFFILSAPYVAAISWSYGQFTLGASGALNYAFHVKHLPHWTNWEGGPSGFGKPIHPPVQLLQNQPAFAFSTPFTTTYPPYNNMAYWYQGFKDFPSVRLQVMAIVRSCYFLAVTVKTHPILVALLLALIVIACRREWRASLLKSLKTFWPLFLPPVLAIGVYLLVHVEDRYLGSFFLILSLLPFALLLDPLCRARRSLFIFLILLYAVGFAAEFKRNAGSTFIAAMKQQSFHDDGQWQLAKALTAHGLEPGDSVALIGDAAPNYRCSWAYVSRIRIVAEFGSLPWRLEPWDRTFFDRGTKEEADENFGQLFWSLSPEDREQILHAFQGTGARAVLSLSQPASNAEPGWKPVGKTGAWIYSFDPQLTASFSLPR